jgi:hypothetical protein
VSSYDVNRDMNVPDADSTGYNAQVLSKGIQAQGASIPREAYNHFIGRLSYNMRKVTEQFGKFADTFLQYASENAGLYDAGLEYASGAVCFTITVTDGVPVYTWYRRTSTTPEVISNVAPPDSVHWTRMSGATMLAQPIRQGQNLDTLSAEGVYYTANDVVGNTVSGLPQVVRELETKLFLLTVTGNTERVKVQTLLVATPGTGYEGYEYTRVMAGGAVVQDWYLSKSPDGLQVTTLPEGVFAFKVEDVYSYTANGERRLVDRGHLFLYYWSPYDNPSQGASPDFEIDGNGHLIWNYGDDAGDDTEENNGN